MASVEIQIPTVSRRGLFRAGAGATVIGASVAAGFGLSSLSRGSQAESKAAVEDTKPFTSLIAPYNARYPKEWTHQAFDFSQQPEPAALFGKKADILSGGEKIGEMQTAITISSEPVEQWVNSKAYQQNILEKWKQEMAKIRMTWNEKPEEIKIVGQAVPLYSGLTENYGVNQAINETVTLAAFVHKGKGWRFIFTTHPKMAKREIENFKKFLTTFKPLE